MLYIPIAKEIIDTLAQPDTDFRAVIGDLSIAELAALSLLLKLPSLLEGIESQESATSASIRAERYLAKFIEVSVGIKLPILQEMVLEQFGADQLSAGVRLCAEIPAYFLSKEEVSGKEYLGEDGLWNWKFQEAKRSDFLPSKVLKRHAKNPTHISQEEERIVNIVLSERDEPISVQGYAGTGKTWIISRLAETLDQNTTLFLADSSAQVKALESRVKGSKGLTFKEIAEAVFSSDLIGPVLHIQRRYGSKKTLSANKLSQLATYLQCYELGGLSREGVARRAWGIVSLFCYSGDAEIKLEHVRGNFPGKESWHQDVLLLVAKSLWELICIPREGIELPIRNYHLVKALSLTGVGIPTYYRLNGIERKCTHIIVDEMHNLTPPLQKILQDSVQPVFRFGDHYQALNGLTESHVLPPTLRKRTLSYSVRAGSNIEKIYNNILEKHPVEPEVEFAGNRTIATKVRHQKKYEIPDEHCTILTQSAWSVLLVIKKLDDNSADFHVLPDIWRELKWLVNDAIAFYKTGRRPRHYDFSHSLSWDDFVARNQRKLPVILGVDKLLRSGFDFPHLENLLRKSTKNSDQAYVVGRVRDSRNSEYEKIRLWDDVAGDNGFQGGSPAKVVSHVYTGISRAKNKLYIPENMLEWFEDF